MKSSRPSINLLLIAVSSFLAASQVIAQSASNPPPRLPAEANVVMKIEVAKMLESPMAKELGWQSKLIKGYADRPLAVPPTARRMTVVAGMHPVGMRAIWQAAIIESINPLHLEPMLRSQGGYLDQIGGKQAAWTAKDLFYVSFDEKTLGVLRPGQRQAVTRWITGKDQPELTPYLKQAWAESSNADVYFAMDLTDLVGTTAIRYAESMGQLPSLEKMQEGADRLIIALASVRGIKLVTNVDKDIQGQLTVDFSADVSALGDNLTPFMTDVLTSADVYEPTIEQWKFEVKGRQIIGRGTMDPEGLGRLLAMLAPPAVAEVTATATTGTAEGQSAPMFTPSTDPQQEAAKASQEYYRAIARSLDAIKPKTSPTQGASWLVAKARAIEQLPIVNVDPALVEWGNHVVSTFNRASQELAVGQQKAMVAAQGVASPTAYTTHYDDYDSAGSSAETRAAFRNAQQQRRQVAQSERTAAGDRALTMLNELLPTRGKIRADMTQKYGVEF